MKKIGSKKGVSPMIAYVLLIIIGISLSLIVYSWIKSQLPGETKECPSEASLIVSDYKCRPGKVITIYFQNKGLFSLDGFFIRASNESGQIPVYPLIVVDNIGDVGIATFDLDIRLEPGANINKTFSYGKLNQIYELGVEPFRMDGKKVMLCKNSIIRMEIEGCT